MADSLCPWACLPVDDLVVAGRLDAAILSLPLGLMELAEQELFEDRFMLAGRAERLVAFGDIPRATDATQSDLGPLLTLGAEHCLGDQVLGACSMWRPQEVHRGAASLPTLSKLVASGAGLTLLPETAALRERAASPELSFLRFVPPEPSRRVGLAYRVASHGQAWIELLAEAASSAGRSLVEEAREVITGAP